jgi:hypothetical protein
MLLSHQEDSMGRRGYPPEFRQRVLDLVAAGRRVGDIARDLGISDQTVYSWRTLVCSTNATASSPVASNPYTISGCSGLSAANYSIGYGYGALTVTPAALTITATASSTTMTYGGPAPMVTPTYTGLVNGNKAPATPPTCTTKATATSPVAGSPCATSCSGASDPDYTITYTNTATITVVLDLTRFDGHVC